MATFSVKIVLHSWLAGQLTKNDLFQYQLICQSLSQSVFFVRHGFFHFEIAIVLAFFQISIVLLYKTNKKTPRFITV